MSRLTQDLQFGGFLARLNLQVSYLVFKSLWSLSHWVLLCYWPPGYSSLRPPFVHCAALLVLCGVYANLLQSECNLRRF
ncbi:hypothetical protein B0H12DRAFT_1155181 [Mycena haematopus]|nr:hypothetical protein B0H12DRAFT_1155181 [Mycena haematopus]